MQNFLRCALRAPYGGHGPPILNPPFMCKMDYFVKNLCLNQEKSVILSFLIGCFRKKWRSKMLVLTRRKEEAIIIGDDIKVSVLEICGNQVKLGIQAPKEITVYRDELYLRIQKGLPETSE